MTHMSGSKVTELNRLPRVAFPLGGAVGVPPQPHVWQEPRQDSRAVGAEGGLMVIFGVTAASTGP